jgi:hypothetical protein
MQSRDVIAGWLSWLVALYAVVSVALRLRFGVDHTDESFYVALAKRFAQGDRPFLDDWSALQLSGYLAAPIAWFSEIVFGGAGVFLAFRVAYLLLRILVVLAVFRYLERAAGRRVALGIGAVFIAPIPFMLPSTSYNTIAISMVALALCGGAMAIVEGSKYGALICGLGFAVAAFAYPTLAVLAVIAAVTLLVLLRDKKLFLWALAGTLPIVCLGVYVLIRFGSGIPDTVAYLSAVGGYAGGGGKIWGVITGIVRLMGAQPAIWAGVAVLTARVVMRRPLPWWVGPLLLVCATQVFGYPEYMMTLVLAIQMTFALLVTTLTVGAPEFERESAWVFVVGLAAILLVAYSSTNGAINGGIAALAVIPAGLAAVARRLRGLAEPMGFVLVMLLACALIVHAVVRINDMGCYRDDPPRTLTYRIESGPYAGMRTSVSRGEYLARLEAFIVRGIRPEDRMAVYSNLPAAYLFSDSRAATPMLWLTDIDLYSGAAPFVLGRLDDPAIGPTVVVRTPEPVMDPVSPNPLDQRLLTRFLEGESAEEARLFRRR